AVESLHSALSAPDPEEVVAALDLLEAYGEAHLVPALVLYHPSPLVVVRALALFRDRAAPTVDPLMPWLLHHPEADVRAATLRTRGSAVAPAAVRDALRRDPSPAVRAAAFAELCRRTSPTPSDRARFEALLEGREGEDALPELARAVAALPPEHALPWLEERAAEPEPAVAAALAEELARAPALPHLPVLLQLLVHPVSREQARRALCALGAPALAALAAALESRSTPRAVRRHLPRSISRFRGAEASRILTDALARERDPRVRHKILRGLGRMRAEEPELALDERPLRALADFSLRRAVELLAFQVGIEGETKTAEGEVLARLLAEKEEAALESVFRVLHILAPDVGYRALFEALSEGDARAEGAAREVLEYVVMEELRGGLLTLVSPAPPRERLAAALVYHEPPPGLGMGGRGPARAVAHPDAAALEALWDAMLADPDPILVALAARARPLF